MARGGVPLALTRPPPPPALPAYDLVYNGVEIGGGSLRIYRRDIQEAVFEAIGLTEAEAMEKFGYLLEAFDYGAPPHGGLAFGLCAPRPPEPPPRYVPITFTLYRNPRP